jgi:TDG/mug DNA glycosylase family protein
MSALPDYLQPGLRVVFVGYNPGTRSAAIGHYYAGRGNLFWPLLYASGLVPEALTYRDDHRILSFGIGLTDLVQRSTPSSADLTAAEARAGVTALQHKLHTYAPRLVCFNGKGVYAWYANRAVTLGSQAARIGEAQVFVVPSTSARNGRLRPQEKAAYFRALQQLVDAP